MGMCQNTTRIMWMPVRSVTLYQLVPLLSTKLGRPKTPLVVVLEQKSGAGYHFHHPHSAVEDTY